MEKEDEKQMQEILRKMDEVNMGHTDYDLLAKDIDEIRGYPGYGESITESECEKAAKITAEIKAEAMNDIMNSDELNEQLIYHFAWTCGDLKNEIFEMQKNHCITIDRMILLLSITGKHEKINMEFRDFFSIACNAFDKGYMSVLIATHYIHRKIPSSIFFEK
jgi:hypothetical protein